jgi:hypothetical protein
MQRKVDDDDDDEKKVEEAEDHDDDDKMEEGESLEEGFMDTMRKVGRKVSPRSNYRDTVGYLQGVEDSLVNWNPMNSFSGVVTSADNAKDSAEGLGIDLSALARTARTLSKSKQSKDDMGDEDLKQQVADLLQQAKAAVANWDAGKKMEESDSQQELKEAIAAVLRKHLRG